MGKKICGYCRVSTALQSTGLESQVLLLKNYFASQGITEYEIFFDENVSGTKASRPGLDRLMAAVKNNEVETVVVPAFSRFARSTTHLLSALSEFKNRSVGFVSLSEKIDTSTPVGVAIFSILAAVSQLERDLIAERVRAGLANARAKGKIIGRKKQRNSEMIRALRKKGLSYRAIADLCGCSHGAVHAELAAQKKEEQQAKLKSQQEKIETVETPIHSSNQLSTAAILSALPDVKQKTNSRSPKAEPTITIDASSNVIRAA